MHRRGEPRRRYLAFASTLSLSGYGNVGTCAEQNTEGGEPVLIDVPCKEVFLYDSAAGKLSCPFCNPSGEAPLGNSTLRRIDGERAWQPQPRYVTDSGRLYFDSSDRLSPLDANGRVEDVYEAEPNGVGSCTRAAGCVTLIPPGTGTVDSNFLAIDQGGEEGGETRQAGADVFFTTREGLVNKDTDELIDLYDAREGGGFASETETQRAECQGEACQPAPAPPSHPTPATSAPAGEGNVPPPNSHRCPKGKVKRHGKCVKKHAKRKHRARKRANPNRRAAR